MSGDTRGFVQVWQLKDIVPGRVALDAIDVRRPPLRARRSWRAGETRCTRVSVPYTPLLHAQIHAPASKSLITSAAPSVMLLLGFFCGVKMSIRCPMVLTPLST